MKRWLAVSLSLALVATLAPDLSEAKRLGGGRPLGMQRQMPARTPPQTPPAQPGAPAPASPNATNPATAGAAAAAPAAAAGKRSWLGPIAGLAAGLGIAALLSHFGLGEGMANILMFALLALAAVFLIRMVLSRLGGAQPRVATAGDGASRSAWTEARPSPAPRVDPAPMQRGASTASDAAPVSVTGVPLAPIGAAAAGDAATTAPIATGPRLPSDFDLPAFERVAKMIFIRLQAANDAGDLDDLREFTTPEMFSNIRLELQERGSVAQATDVERVDAEVVDFVQESARQVASVRFHGLVSEEKGAPAVPFDEVWHLVRPADGSRAWAIAGIQQPA